MDHSENSAFSLNLMNPCTFLAVSLAYDISVQKSSRPENVARDEVFVLLDLTDNLGVLRGLQ